MQEKHTSRKPKDGQDTANERMFLFRDLAEKSLVGIYLIHDKLFRYTNERMGQIFGYSVEEIIDRMGPEHLVYLKIGRSTMGTSTEG